MEQPQRNLESRHMGRKQWDLHWWQQLHDDGNLCGGKLLQHSRQKHEYEVFLHLGGYVLEFKLHDPSHLHRGRHLFEINL